MFQRRDLDDESASAQQNTLDIRLTALTDIKTLSENLTNLNDILNTAYQLARLFSSGNFLKSQKIIIPTQKAGISGEQLESSDLLPTSVDENIKDTSLFLSDSLRIISSLGLKAKKNFAINSNDIAKTIFDFYFPNSNDLDTYHLKEWAQAQESTQHIDEIRLYENRWRVIHLLAVMIATIEFADNNIANPNQSQEIIAQAEQLAQTGPNTNLVQHSYDQATGGKKDADADGGAESQADTSDLTDQNETDKLQKQEAEEPATAPISPPTQDFAQAKVPFKIGADLAGVRAQSQADIDKALSRANYETQWIYNRLLFELETSQGIKLGIDQKHHLRLLVFRAVQTKNLPLLFANPIARLKVLNEVITTLNKSALFRQRNLNIDPNNLQSVGEGVTNKIAVILGQDSAPITSSVLAAADGLAISYGEKVYTLLEQLELSNQEDRMKFAHILRLPSNVSLDAIQAFSLRNALFNYFSYKFSEMLMASQEQDVLKGLIQKESAFGKDMGAFAGGLVQFQQHFSNHSTTAIQEGVAKNGLSDLKRSAYATALFISEPQVRKKRVDLLRTYAPVWNSLSGKDQRIIYDFYGVAYDKNQDNINQLPMIPEITQFNIGWLDDIRQAIDMGVVSDRSELLQIASEAEFLAIVSTVRQQFLSAYMRQLNASEQETLAIALAQEAQNAQLIAAQLAEEERVFWLEQYLQNQDSFGADGGEAPLSESQMQQLSISAQNAVALVPAGMNNLSVASLASTQQKQEGGGGEAGDGVVGKAGGLGQSAQTALSALKGGLAGNIPAGGNAKLAAALEIAAQSKGNPWAAAALTVKKLLTDKEFRQMAFGEFKKRLKQASIAGLGLYALYKVAGAVLKAMGTAAIKVLAATGAGAVAGFMIAGPVGAIVGGGLAATASATSIGSSLFGSTSGTQAVSAGSGVGSSTAGSVTSGSEASGSASSLEASGASSATVSATQAGGAGVATTSTTAQAASALSSVSLMPIFGIFTLSVITMHVFMIIYGAFLVPSPTSTGSNSDHIGGIAGCWPTTGHITVVRTYRDGRLHATARSAFGFRGPGTAIDIGGPVGTPVYTPFAGEARYFSEPNGIDPNYGNHVVVITPKFLLIFAHLSDLSQPAGTTKLVVAGEEVGKMGSTGNSTGSHLHYEVLGEDIINIVPFTEREKMLADTDDTQLWGKPVSSNECSVNPGEDDPNASGYVAVGPANKDNLVASSDAEILAGATLTCNWWSQKGNLAVAINANYYNQTNRIIPIGLAGYSATNSDAVRYYADPLDRNGNISPTLIDQLHSLVVDGSTARWTKTNPAQSGYLAITGIYKKDESNDDANKKDAKSDSIAHRTAVGLGRDNGTCSDGAYRGQQVVFVAVMRSTTFTNIEQYLNGCGATQVIHMDGGGSTSLCSSEFSMPSSRHVPVNFGMKEASVKSIQRQ